MESYEDHNPENCWISSLSGIWSEKRQSQIESGQENPPKFPFNKGGLNISPLLKRGVRGDFETKGISY